MIAPQIAFKIYDFLNLFFAQKPKIYQKVKTHNSVWKYTSKLISTVRSPTSPYLIVASFNVQRVYYDIIY